MNQQRVKYSELLPGQFRKRLAAMPVAYLPLGTLEWHGEHLPLGADSLQSEALFCEAAMRFGGIVLPPVFLGPDRITQNEDGSSWIGMDTAVSTQPHQQLTGSAYWVPDSFFIELVANLLRQLQRAGFKAVFADGHGPSRRLWNQQRSTWQQQTGLELGGVEAEQLVDWNYMIDHAARNETSIMAYHYPELVDLTSFPKGIDSPLLGVNGKHPFEATAVEGQQLTEQALNCLGQWVKALSLP